MPEIDFHTHRLKSETSIQILNVFAQDLPFRDIKTLYSAGLHPWHIGSVNACECFHSMNLSADHSNMLAIGECGLDRSIDVDFAIQETHFKQQTEIAEKYSKPLIIHCVRAFHEVIRLKKEYRSTLPWIIHGFNGNRSTILQLIRHNFYFSVGESLLKNPHKKDILPLIPIDHLFLETDDRETSISSIYTLAAQLLKVDEETLGGLLLENFKVLFGNIPV